MTKNPNSNINPFIYRSFQVEDVQNLSKWLSRNPVEHYFTSSRLPFPTRSEDFLEYYYKNPESPSYRYYSVLESTTGRHIGHFEFKDISEKHKNGTLAHVILGELAFRGKGMGKWLVWLMARCGFEDLKLERIGLSVHIGNRNAVAAYVLGGFIVEGIIRDVLEHEGLRHSLYQMSLLKKEWQKQHGELF